MLIIFQTVSPLWKTFVPLKQSTTDKGFFSIHSPDHLKRFAGRSAWFLAEPDISLTLKLRHSRFPPLADEYPS
jgi:hypothetical protein